MIQDIYRIQEELEGYHEIELPYEFSKGLSIKYLTMTKDEEESFYPGGRYQGMGHNCLYLTNDYKQWTVPMKLFHKDGSTRFQTRFFVPKDTSNLKECNMDVKELTDTVLYQQEIIEKLVARLQLVETERVHDTEKVTTYEDLLSQSREKLQEMVTTLRSQEDQLSQYKTIIKQLSS